ncbi:MAG: hypothetical protein ACXWC9_11070 [Pseudobdellovibrionaceae bacterium]
MYLNQKVLSLVFLSLGLIGCQKSQFVTESLDLASSDQLELQADDEREGTSQAPTQIQNPNPEMNTPPDLSSAPVPYAINPLINLKDGDFSFLIDTAVPLGEEAFVCIQNDADASYPCQNGAIANRYSKAMFHFADGVTSLWKSKDVFADSEIDFGDFTVFVMKKDSRGELTELVGTVRVSFRLPELEPNRYWSSADGGGFTSTSGPNKFYASCVVPNVTTNIPSDYKRYPYYSNKECFYKIVR